MTEKQLFTHGIADKVDSGLQASSHAQNLVQLDRLISP